MNTKGSIEQLLEDELSAMETYECLLEKFKLPDGHLLPGGRFVRSSLNPLLKDHENAVSTLKTKAQQESTTLKGSAVWGNIEKLVLEQPEFVGKKSAVQELLEGEKNMEMDYLQALENPGLDSETRRLIQDELLPTQQSHVRSLDRMITVLAA
jgi:hypothetical protein